MTCSHRVGCFMALLMLNLVARWGWVINATPGSLYPWERAPVPTVQEAMWFFQCRSVRVWRRENILPQSVLELLTVRVNVSSNLCLLLQERYVRLFESEQVVLSGESSDVWAPKSFPGRYSVYCKRVFSGFLNHSPFRKLVVLVHIMLRLIPSAYFTLHKQINNGKISASCRLKTYSLLPCSWRLIAFILHRPLRKRLTEWNIIS